MVKLSRDINTGRLIRCVNEGKKLLRGCCNVFSPTYSAYNCCCFLDPTPAEWDAGETYAAGDMVSYSGSNYYSLLDDNTNHTPTGGDPWWDTYTSCESDDWDSVPPFGGIGKTPEYYLIALKFSGNFSAYSPTYDIYPLKMQCNIQMLSIFQRGSGTSCAWTPSEIIDCDGDWLVSREYVSQSELNFEETGDLAKEDIIVQYYNVIDLYNGQLRFEYDFELGFTPNSFNAYRDAAGYTGGCTVNKWVKPRHNYYSIDVCDIKGTLNGDESCTYGSVEESREVDISWTPMVADFTLYSITEDYSPGDYVAFDGHFWQCCIQNGPGHATGVHNPTGTETACTGSNYWRLII